MAKRKPKSLSSIASKMPSVDLDKIEDEVSKVHGKVQVETTKVEPPKLKKSKVEPKPVRVTVDTPKSLHTLLKRILLDVDLGDVKDLKSFYLKAVKEKCERLGYQVKE